MSHQPVNEPGAQHRRAALDQSETSDPSEETSESTGFDLTHRELRKIAARLEMNSDIHNTAMHFYTVIEYAIQRLKAFADHEEALRAQREAANQEYESEQLRLIEKIVKDHQERIRIHHCGGIAEVIAQIIEHYHTHATRSMSHIELFQQELLVQFRALALIADSVADGQTHGEKNARIRGLISMLESAYDRISKWRLDVQSSLPPWSYGAVFDAKYPAQHYLARINDLETALAKATGQPITHSVFPVKERDSDPFSDASTGSKARW